MSLHEIGRLFNRRLPGNLEIQPGRHHFPLPAGHHHFRTTMIYTHVLNRGAGACAVRQTHCLDGPMRARQKPPNAQNLA